MSNRATFTLDDEAWDFLKSRAGQNRSAYINRLLRQEKERSLADLVLKANQEEAQDSVYQTELSYWDVTLTDGLSCP